MSVNKAQLIEDLKRVSNLAVESGTHMVSGVTRDFYRSNGMFSEKNWTKHFGTFDNFCNAAGVNQPSMVSKVEGSNWSVFIPSTTLCSATDVIEFCKVDLSTWELERFRAKDVTKSGDELPAFQISAFFKKRTNIIKIRKEIDDMKNSAKAGLKRKIDKIERPATLSGNMLEVNISDHHFGKLAWPVETGHEPYDVQIAQAMFMRALNTLIERTKGYKFDQVLFVCGNDLLNSDNAENTTTKGTVVTTDIRYHKTFRIVRETVVEAIEKLRSIAPVKVLVVPGNHDELASYHLGDSLECWFHEHTDVVVENQPRNRKYHEFGKVMLCFTHGEKGNPKDYPLLIAAEQPEMWARTKFREIHTGHIHQDKVSEMHGVKVRILSALCPPDDWHSSEGYVGNLRSAEAFIWNKDEGLVATAIYTDNAFPTIFTKREIV